MADRLRLALKLLARQDRAVKRKLQAVAIATRHRDDVRAYQKYLDEVEDEMTPQEKGRFAAARMEWRRLKM